MQHDLTGRKFDSLAEPVAGALLIEHQIRDDQIG
jgi:hypothetical protein